MDRVEIEAAVQSFFQFIRLPDEVKNNIFYHINPENRGTRTGYTRQQRGKGDTDTREYFHYNEHFVEHFKDSTLLKDPVVENFLSFAEKIYQLGKGNLQQIIQIIDPHYPGLYQQFFQDGVKPNLYLRFLKYDNLADGDFLAKGHYDRGSCTLAIAESAPGLRIGKNDTNVNPVQNHPGQALFMPGLVMNELTSAEFSPAWHDVVQKPEHVYSDEIARWAIVLFCDNLNLRNVQYEEAHTARY